MYAKRYVNRNVKTWFISCSCAIIPCRWPTGVPGKDSWTIGDTKFDYHTRTTRTSVATHPRACQVQSGTCLVRQ